MTTAPTLLRAGERAVDFELDSHHGALVRLSELRRDSRVLLVFFPFAFTPVCGSEMRDLAEKYADFTAAGIEPVAISTDPKYSLAAWAEAEGIPFSLLSDFWPHGEVSRAYGVFREDRGMARRGTFLVDEEGFVVSSSCSPDAVQRDFSGFLTPTNR